MSSFLEAFSTVSGYPAEIAILSVALILQVRRSPIAARRTMILNALLLFASFLLFRLMGRMLKVGLAVPRPCWDPAHPSLTSCPMSFSFPSGHALGSGMVAMLLGLIFRKKTVWIVGITLSLMIAASRVALGVHTPLDVLAGLALGYVFGWISWRVFWHD